MQICPVKPEKALTMECEKPEFRYTADAQLWGPPEALVAMGRENEPLNGIRKTGILVPCQLMSEVCHARNRTQTAIQLIDFKNGDEMAALAARQIKYHIWAITR